jgi:hypothetical protein
MNCILDSRRPAGIACAIGGHAFVTSACSALATLRDAAPPPGAPALPPRFLRHSDEHTVVAMRAVLEAIAACAEPPPSDRVAIVAAPCQSGRIVAARSLAQLAVGGAVTVSPHLVPQASLHSVAGAVSVGLGLHGPHLGVGGGPDALVEGLVTAASLLAPASGCDAAWFIATDWETEPVLDAVGAPTGDPVCRALALALVPPAAAPARPTLLIGPASTAIAPEADVDLGELAQAIAAAATGRDTVAWSACCPWRGTIRLALPAGAAEASFPLRASA